MLDRFNSNEMTLSRFISGISRRIQDIPHLIAWNELNHTSMNNQLRLGKYQNKHAGERCIIIANGPSLAKMDLSPLKKEITFGMNRIYLLFDKLDFFPNYYACVNEFVIDEFSHDIRLLPMPKFLNWNKRLLFDITDENIHFVRQSISIKDFFGKDPRRPLASGGTVTYSALQIAYYMGFTEVILIGLDHSYKEKGTPNKLEVRSTEQDESHFHPNYFPKGVKWQLPDLLRSEVAYKLARDTYEADHRKIIDATIDGKCQIFQKEDFNSIFPSIK